MGRTGRAKDAHQRKKVDIPPLDVFEALNCIVLLAAFRHDRTSKSKMGVIQQNEIDALCMASDALLEWILTHRPSSEYAANIPEETVQQLVRLLKANKLTQWRETKQI